MLSKKTIFIVTLLTLILIGGVAIGYFINKSQGPKIYSSPPPNIPQVFKGKVNFVFDLKDKNYKPPIELPTLEVTNSPLNETDLNTISSKLFLGKDPIVDKDVDNGDVYTWFDDYSSLVITPNLRKIEYFAQNPIPKTKAGHEDSYYSKEAENFLSFNQIISSGEIEFDSVKYLTTSPETEGYVQTSKEQATIVQVNFKYKNSQYKIVDLNPSLEKVFVRMLPDGKVQEVQATWMGTIKVSSVKYTLKNIDEVVASSQNAILMSVENLYTGLDLIDPKGLMNVTINEVEVVYLLDKPDSQILQPVYILKGDGIYKPTNVNVKLLFYLPALKGY